MNNEIANFLTFEKKNKNDTVTMQLCKLMRPPSIKCYNVKKLNGVFVWAMNFLHIL